MLDLYLMVYRKDTSNEFKEKFAKTVAFMNAKGSSGMLNKLNNQSKTTLVDNTGGGSYYRPRTGELFWDRDGIGGVAQTKIATLTNDPFLTHTNFRII
jgi:hypothetical protein